MIERRLYYLQTRVDAVPRGVRSAGTDERQPHLGGRIHRLLTGHRRPGTDGAVR